MITTGSHDTVHLCYSKAALIGSGPLLSWPKSKQGQEWAAFSANNSMNIQLVHFAVFFLFLVLTVVPIQLAVRIQCFWIFRDVTQTYTSPYT